MAVVFTYTLLIEKLTKYLERETDAGLVAMAPTFALFGQKRIAREVKTLGLQNYVTGTFTASNGVVTKPQDWLRTLSINWGGGSGCLVSATVTAGGTGYTYPITVTLTGGAGTGGAISAFHTNGVITQLSVTSPGSGYTSAPTLSFSTVGTTGTGATGTSSILLTNVVRNSLLVRSYEFCRSYWPNPTLTGDPKFYADYDIDHWLIAPTPSASSPIEIAYYGIAELLDATTETNFLTEQQPDLLLYACMLEAELYLKNDERIAVAQAMYDRAKEGYQAEDKGRMTDRMVSRGA